jgi:hypothetical protein
VIYFSHKYCIGKASVQVYISQFSSINEKMEQIFECLINDFPLAIDGSAMPILFADDTSLIVTIKNLIF